MIYINKHVGTLVAMNNSNKFNRLELEMYTYNKQIITAAVIASMSALSACSSDDEEVEPATADVSIQFAAQVNGTDFTCGDT